MDYLDPDKKKKKKIRLMVGYALLGVAISIATVVFVYLTNGYYIDSETGGVIQNGLIYVDSKPESAEVYLNGEKQRGSTDARLVVPEGIHTIGLNRNGYRPWERKVTLEGGSLRRLTYARLVPNELETQQALNLLGIPNDTSQSIDKRWIVMSFDTEPFNLKMVDLNREQFLLEDIPLPVDIVEATETGKWKFIEWADDNRTFLASYTTGDKKEFVMIDRETPDESVNIKTVFPSTVYSDVKMRDRKNDLVFLHNQSTGAVLQGNLSSGETEPFLGDIIQYSPFGNDIILYVTKTGAKEGYVKAMFKKGSDEYELREIKQDKKYLLEIAKLGNAMVMGIGSEAEGRVIVYNDPINALKENDFSTLPVPTTVLRVSDPKELTISSDSSVILARGSDNFASHEFEDDRSYNFKLEKPFDDGQKLRWMDGQHLTYSYEGKQYMVDFDGSNQYELVESIINLGSYFDAAIDHGFTFLPAAQEGSPPRMMRTFMRTSADR
jgi:hypothetical protein